MKDSGFHSLYETECHVCANTMEIFEKAQLNNLCIETLARDIGATTEELEALQDADHCDPHLVIHLSRRLGLQPPESCPKINRLRENVQ